MNVAVGLFVLWVSARVWSLRVCVYIVTVILVHTRLCQDCCGISEPLPILEPTVDRLCVCSCDEHTPHTHLHRRKQPPTHTLPSTQERHACANIYIQTEHAQSYTHTHTLK
eukprot:GHVQ01010570.1.p2 GENE.GHVQ01010570.1~~GHVQ01010570.1.p2  ORF type:complete len:111 (-),score=11.35 GHVQ01010570.1:1112-1444(-)